VSRETRETLQNPPAFEARTPQFYEQHDWRYQADKRSGWPRRTPRWRASWAGVEVERVLPRLAALEETWLRNGFEMVSSMRPLTDVVEDILLRCGLPPGASK
jgi:hypothetical protein